jgi:hypothetical protein
LVEEMETEMGMGAAVMAAVVVVVATTEMAW